MRPILNDQAVTTVYLVRHGKSQLNLQRKVSGQLDPLLAIKGSVQSQQLAKILHDEPLIAIYTSTLARTVETARPTAQDHDLPIQQHDAFREIHHGILQGRYRDERDPEAKRLWEEREKDKQHYRIPGGETFGELEQRVSRCLGEILKISQGKTILIVGHRSTNRILLGTLMQWPKTSWCDLNLRGKFLYLIQLGEAPHVTTISLDERTAGLQYEGFRM